MLRSPEEECQGWRSVCLAASPPLFYSISPRLEVEWPVLATIEYCGSQPNGSLCSEAREGQGAREEVRENERG